MMENMPTEIDIHSVLQLLQSSVLYIGGYLEDHLKNGLAAAEKSYCKLESSVWEGFRMCQT